MVFTKTKIEGIQKEFKELETIMKDLHFLRWTWDYEKVVYDKKYMVGDNTYFLRLRADVVNDIPLEDPKALLELQQPVFAEHFFPHGLDNTVKVPEGLLEEIESILSEIATKLS
jgi:hypothetical protein